MFLRKDGQFLAKGRRVHYVSLVHNIWESPPGRKPRAKPVKIMSFGRADEIDMELAELMREVAQRRSEKYQDLASKRRGLEEIARRMGVEAPAIRVLCSKAFGMRAALEATWTRLGLKKLLDGLVKQSRITWPFERIVFGMVLHRLVSPGSKRAAMAWLHEDAWFPELKPTSLDHLYKALDVLDRHAAEVGDALFVALKEDLSATETFALLLDTTSLYTETDLDDRERAKVLDDHVAARAGLRSMPRIPMPRLVNNPPLRLRGKSKDGRPSNPQVVVGLLAGGDGRALRHAVYAGNTSDQRITPKMLEYLKNDVLTARGLMVMDSGMASMANLMAIDELGMRRVSAVPMRSSKLAEALLAKPGRWRAHATDPNLQIRSTFMSREKTGLARDELWVATRNAKEADRQTRKLEALVARAETHLTKNNLLDESGKARSARLRVAPLARLVVATPGRRHLTLNRTYIEKERRRAGVHLLRTTATTFTAEEVVQYYRDLLKVEGNFRHLKSTIEARPMHHQADRRIRGHMMVNFLALVCLQEMERRTGKTFRTLHTTLGSVRVAQTEVGRSQTWRLEELTDSARQCLEQLDAWWPREGWSGDLSWAELTAEQTSSSGSRSKTARRGQARSSGRKR